MTEPALDPDDATLVGRARSGDAGAFEALVIRHQRAVFATACAVLGDTNGAEDIAQETFLVGWRSLARLLNPAQVRPWLTGIARHLAVSEIRRRGRAAAPLPELPEPGAPDPLEGRIAAEATAADVAGLRAALAALSDRQREIVTLRYFGDLSYRDIAETLGLTLDVVQVTLFRAKQALGRNLRKIRGPQAT